MNIPDEAVQAALAHYSEGGCMGLDEHERREVTEAMLYAALPHLGKVDTLGCWSLEWKYEDCIDRKDTAPSPRAQALEEAAKNCEKEADEVGGLIDDVAHHLRKRAAAIRALSSQPEADGSAASRDVLAERRRQVEKEGWTPEHDDQWQSGEMSGAAACYALNGATYKAPSHYPPRKVYAAVAEARRDAEKDMSITREAIRMAIGEPKAPTSWPWNAEWWKPSDRRRNLVKSGALILAEIERLDRLPASPGASE